MKLNKNNDSYVWGWIFVDIILNIGYFILLTGIVLNLSSMYNVPYLSTMSFTSLMCYLVVIKTITNLHNFNYKDLVKFIDSETDFRKLFYANGLLHITKYLAIMYFWSIGTILYLLIKS